MCPICGGPYVYGNADLHKNCREEEKRRAERNQRVDEMLAWWETWRHRINQHIQND